MSMTKEQLSFEAMNGRMALKPHLEPATGMYVMIGYSIRGKWPRQGTESFNSLEDCENEIKNCATNHPRWFVDEQNYKP
jgi:hypothetical protein